MIRIVTARRATLAAAVMALFSIAPVSGALAAGLLGPAPADAASAASPRAAVPQAIRERVAALDYGYMESNMVPLGIDRAPGRVQQAPRGMPLRLELFPDTTVTLTRDGLQRSQGGGYVWSGRIRGEPQGFGVFVISDGEVLGQVQTDGRLFRIEPAGDGRVRVVELNGSQYPGDIVIPAPPGNAPASPDQTGDAEPEALRVIRVLMPYTTRARDQAPAILKDLRLALALANRAYKLSGVNFRVKLAKAMLVRNYDETAVSFSQNLYDVSEGKGPFRAVHVQRNRTKADLVAFITTGTQYCGIGWYQVNPSKSTAAYGFSVTARVCIPNHTVAHEMGHNAGLQHDRYVEDSQPNSVYNFGYVDKPARFRTVMAYDNACYDSGFSCTRVPFFSTPRKRFKRKPVGIAAGREGAAFNARKLNETSRGIASYR